MKRAPRIPEQSVLDAVEVRLIEEWERERYDGLLEREHYLHNARLGGRHLRYVAEVEGRWVALATFSGAAPHLKGRECWIGWSPRQRARRLGLVANNSRFLVLEERGKVPNLASKVLGLCLRRVSGDWQQRWGTPLLVVESFVDEHLYRGTCYRACGFEAVGASAGFGRDARDYYTEHGRPKQLYLKALHPKGREMLRRAVLPAPYAEAEADIAGPCPLRAPELGDLLRRLRALKDPRRGHGLRHRQASVLACAAAASLMGAGSYQGFEDVCERFNQRQLAALGCYYDEKLRRYRAPSDTTFLRVLERVDPAAFEAILSRWLLEQEIGQLQRLAVDGKTLRGSGGREGEGRAVQLLSAVTHSLRTTLRSQPIAEKSNEIPAIEPLLRGLPIEGSICTADAMHCQQETARLITQVHGADYLFGLKGNQSGILERAQHRLEPVLFSPGE
jgi:hypothetical protein